MGGKNSYESTHRYQLKAYDRIGVMVRKGEKEIYAAHAAARGESLNAFIRRAIMECMKNDKSAAPAPVVPDETESAT
jgi:predicted HicB family RNase H-like nuclease